MQQTTNYNLKKIELTDSPPDITVINPNWDTIDSAIKSVDNNLVVHETKSATQLALGHIKLSETWKTATLLNGWVDFTGYSGLGFCKDDLGIVRLKGIIRNGVGTSGTNLFILPEGYRPSVILLIGTTANNVSTIVAAGIEIWPNGDVKLAETTPTAWLSLENITFRV